MRRREPIDWRQKVNPIFTLAIQFLRFIPRLIRELRQSWPDSEPHIRTLLVKACEETMPLLPVSQGLQPAKAHENRPESGNIAAAVSGEIESTVEAVEAVCLSDRSVRFERITGHRCLLWERR